MPEPSASSSEEDLFRSRLDNMINQRHELCRLAKLIDWPVFDAVFGSLYSPDKGCPGKPTRLMVGLHYLKHIHNLSDEEVVSGWVENPYWQYFCGETHFQHEPPIDPSSMTRFRKRIGTQGGELILSATVSAGMKSKTVKPSDVKRVTVDTTVQEKAVAFPTDSRLLNRSRERLVRLCREHGVTLRQSYARKGPQALLMANRYAHARQMKRMNGQVRKLRTWLGRVVRDMERKSAGNAVLEAALSDELALAKRLLSQRKKDSNKLYSLHAPEVECIAKGKAHKRYEFGTKVSIAVTNRGNFIVGGMALPGNPYDGHTLGSALQQVYRLTGKKVREVFADKGYRGHGVEDSQVYISGQKRGVNTARLKKCLKRRQAVEPVIGHLKSDGRLGCNWLQGTEGDQMNVLTVCAGHNLRLILSHLRIFCARFFWLLCSWTAGIAPRRKGLVCFG